MFKKLYLHLFNRVTDALKALEAGDPLEAREVLIAAQRECEELYLACGEESQKPLKPSPRTGKSAPPLPVADEGGLV